jgi:hypothetical protein
MEHGAYRYVIPFELAVGSRQTPGEVTDATQDSDFTDSFCEFLQRSVKTVDAAELLLLIYRQRDHAWTGGELVLKLEPTASVTEAEAAKELDGFEQRGLVGRAEDQRRRYHPASPELDGHVRTLAKLYNERPVTLIRMIYALRDAKIKTFADAFKIWGK